MFCRTIQTARLGRNWSVIRIIRHRLCCLALLVGEKPIGREKGTGGRWVDSLVVRFVRRTATMHLCRWLDVDGTISEDIVAKQPTELSRSLLSFSLAPFLVFLRFSRCTTVARQWHRAWLRRRCADTLQICTALNAEHRPRCSRG